MSSQWPVQPDRPRVSHRRSWLKHALAGIACAALPERASTAPEVPAAPNVPSLAFLLGRNHELSPDFKGGYSNHVSMALYSLSALGATVAALARFAETQWAPLEPLPSDPGPRVTPDNWKALLGRHDAQNGFRALFSDEIAKLGRDATLRKYLPALLPGVGAAGFHALIRTGYGVRFGDDREVSDGLAYWATAFLPLGLLVTAGREPDPRALLLKANQTSALAGANLSSRLVHGKMKAASLLPGFSALASALGPNETTLPRIAASAIRLYVQSGDFTALHAVTSAHAYRLLQPCIEPRAEGLRYFWQAFLAAHVSAGAPQVAEAPEDHVPPWTESVKRAISSRDAHDVKLVDVVREEDAFYHDPIYRRAAARRMRLI